MVDEEGKPTAPGVGGRLVLKRPYPCMLRTVWHNPARYERDWQQIPGYYVTEDVAVKDKDGYMCQPWKDEYCVVHLKKSPGIARAFHAYGCSSLPDC